MLLYQLLYGAQFCNNLAISLYNASFGLAFSLISIHPWGERDYVEHRFCCHHPTGWAVSPQGYPSIFFAFLLRYIHLFPCVEKDNVEQGFYFPQPLGEELVHRGNPNILFGSPYRTPAPIWTPGWRKTMWTNLESPSLWSRVQTFPNIFTHF